MKQCGKEVTFPKGVLKLRNFFFAWTMGLVCGETISSAIYLTGGCELHQNFLDLVGVAIVVPLLASDILLVSIEKNKSHCWHMLLLDFHIWNHLT